MSKKVERTECDVCSGPLTGRQTRFCSNKCKQSVKNRERAEAFVRLRKENKRLLAKVKRLEAKLAA